MLEQIIVAGEQGRQWLRASLELQLPAAPRLEMQIIIDAYVSGTRSPNNKGDIAIDDIIIKTNGQCRQPAGE